MESILVMLLVNAMSVLYPAPQQYLNYLADRLVNKITKFMVNTMSVLSQQYLNYWADRLVNTFTKLMVNSVSVLCPFVKQYMADRLVNIFMKHVVCAFVICMFTIYLPVSMFICSFVIGLIVIVDCSIRLYTQVLLTQAVHEEMEVHEPCLFVHSLFTTLNVGLIGLDVDYYIWIMTHQVSDNNEMVSSMLGGCSGENACAEGHLASAVAGDNNHVTSDVFVQHNQESLINQSDHHVDVIVECDRMDASINQPTLSEVVTFVETSTSLSVLELPVRLKSVDQLMIVNKLMVNQSFNQSINQSTKRSNTRSIQRSSHHPTQVHDKENAQSNNQSMRRATMEPIKQSMKSLHNQSLTPMKTLHSHDWNNSFVKANKSFQALYESDQSINQPIKQAIKQSNKQSSVVRFNVPSASLMQSIGNVRVRSSISSTHLLNQPLNRRQTLS